MDLSVERESEVKTHLRVARPFLVVLLLFAVGRLAQGGSVPYEKGHHIFSLLTLTLIAAAFHGAFVRRWLGYGAAQALTLGALMGFAAQLVIFTCTVASFLLGVETYFNHPIALNLAYLGDSAETVATAAATKRSLGDALARRAGGLVFGSLLGALSAGIGWALGALLPADPRKD